MGLAPHIKIGQAAERAINNVINMASAILMQAWMICHKGTLSIDFGQQKWIMLYRSKVGSLIYSMVYKPLGKFEPSMFLDPRFHKPEVKTLKWAPMSQRRVNMGFGTGYSTQAGLIMNIKNDLGPLKFHIVSVALALA